MSTKVRNLQDLLIEQLQDLYSAEEQILEALPKVERKINNQKLKDAIHKHLEETKGQKGRLDQIAVLLKVDLGKRKCKAIEGILAEAESFMKEDAKADVMDAGIIANAQRVEHYEIAGYGTVIAYAERLGLQETTSLLKETLEEEKKADSKLTELAVETINEEALS